MTIDPKLLLSRPFPSIEHAFTRRDTQLYALGLGIGCEPLDERALRYVYEGIRGDQLRAVPTMVNVLAYPGFWAREPDTGIDWRRLVHAEQAIELCTAVPPEGRVIGR